MTKWKDFFPPPAKSRIYSYILTPSGEFTKCIILAARRRWKGRERTAEGEGGGHKEEGKWRGGGGEGGSGQRLLPAYCHLGFFETWIPCHHSPLPQKLISSSSIRPSYSASHSAVAARTWTSPGWNMHVLPDETCFCAEIWQDNNAWPEKWKDLGPPILGKLS